MDNDSNVSIRVVKTVPFCIPTFTVMASGQTQQAKDYQFIEPLDFHPDEHRADTTTGIVISGVSHYHREGEGTGDSWQPVVLLVLLILASLKARQSKLVRKIRKAPS